MLLYIMYIAHATEVFIPRLENIFFLLWYIHILTVILNINLTLKKNNVRDRQCFLFYCCWHFKVQWPEVFHRILRKFYCWTVKNSSNLQARFYVCRMVHEIVNSINDKLVIKWVRNYIVVSLYNINIRIKYVIANKKIITKVQMTKMKAIIGNCMPFFN